MLVLTISRKLEKAVTAGELPNFELDNLFPGSVKTKNSMWFINQILSVFFLIRGMVENSWTLGKIQPWPTG